MSGNEMAPFLAAALRDRMMADAQEEVICLWEEIARLRYEIQRLRATSIHSTTAAILRNQALADVQEIRQLREENLRQRDEIQRLKGTPTMELVQRNFRVMSF